MQESESDYMSDLFLREVEDVRPGLLNREAKRKLKVEKNSTKELPQTKKIKIIENEAREQGLSLPISSDNKGFTMLQKMGYKEGMSLGKSGDGKTSLIPLVVKDGKTGLGRKTFVAEKESKIKTQQARDFTDFRHRKQASLSQTRMKSDLHKSKMACLQLDTAHGLSGPSVEWYWPEESIPKPDEESDTNSEEDEDSDNDIEPSEQLEHITTYLRASYFYCIWCGTAYQDSDDLEENCPGDNEEAHE